MHFPFVWGADDIPSAYELAVMAAEDERDRAEDRLLDLDPLDLGDDEVMPLGVIDDEPF